MVNSTSLPPHYGLTSTNFTQMVQYHEEEGEHHDIMVLGPYRRGVFSLIRQTLLPANHSAHRHQSSDHEHLLVIITTIFKIHTHIVNAHISSMHILPSPIFISCVFSLQRYPYSPPITQWRHLLVNFPGKQGVFQLSADLLSTSSH